jgi:hypothetical protein
LRGKRTRRGEPSDIAGKIIAHRLALPMIDRGEGGPMEGREEKEEG